MDARPQKRDRSPDHKGVQHRASDQDPDPLQHVDHLSLPDGAVSAGMVPPPRNHGPNAVAAGVTAPYRRTARARASGDSRSVIP